ncbi:unnamed protein product [Discosporangium mesarthrocarpum]
MASMAPLSGTEVEEVEVNLGAAVESEPNEYGEHPLASERTLRYERCLRRRSVRFLLRVTNLVFASVFIWSAILQYNDPDGALWGLIYALAAAFCILSELSWRNLRKYAVLPALQLYFCLVLAGSVYILVARIIVARKKLSGEEGLEFGGLTVVWVWMAVVLMLDRHNIVGLFRGYTSLGHEQGRDKQGHVQMGEVVL